MQNSINFNQLGNSNIGDGTLNRVPIRRTSTFYADADFEFEQKIGMDYLAQDMNMTVVLYRVDHEKTNIDDTYKETGKHNVQFLTPIELSCVYDLKESELKSYEKESNRGVYKQVGTVEVSIYQKELDEKGKFLNDGRPIEINNGDYIGIQVTPMRMEFFTVFDNGMTNFGNPDTMYGLYPFFRKIKCAPVDANEFDGK